MLHFSKWNSILQGKAMNESVSSIIWKIHHPNIQKNYEKCKQKSHVLPEIVFNERSDNKDNNQVSVMFLLLYFWRNHKKWCWNYLKMILLLYTLQYIMIRYMSVCDKSKYKYWIENIQIESQFEFKPMSTKNIDQGCEHWTII